MKKVLLLIFGLLAGTGVWGQNGLIGNGFGTADWSTIDNFSAGVGSSGYYSSKPNEASGDKYFRLVDNYDANSNEQFGPTSTTDDYAVTIGVPIPTAQVNRNSTTKAYKINANSSYNYIFKTKHRDETSNNGNLIVFEVQGDVQNVTSVSTGSISPYNPTTVTATISNPFSAGQGAYLRYTKENFATSSVVVPMTGSGTTFTANIPADYNIPGVEVKYYVFTSGDNLSITSTDADFYTINLNNNDGSNFSYTPTSNINWCNLDYPDNTDNVIVMGQDYIIKSQIYIDGVTNTGTTVDSRVKGWIGYSSSNTHPATWTNWVEASGSDTGNNYQYTLNTRNLLPSVSSGTFYIATRYQFDGGDYVYGGWNTDNGAGGKGGFWGRTYNGTVSVSGKLIVQEIALNGDALNNTDWSVYAPLYSTDGENFSTTVYLYENKGLKFVQNRDYTNNKDWGCSSCNFSSGTATLNGGYNFTVPSGGAGTYLVTLNISTNAYTFSNSNCTSSTTTTWNGSAWDNGNPDFTKKAIINSDYNTADNGTISACECQINANKKVTVANNTYFTVAKKITNYGTIEVNNTGNVIQYETPSTNDGNGSYIVKKTTAAAKDYDYIYWSSPLDNAQIETVFSENPPYKYEFVTNNFLDLYSGNYPQTSGSSDGYDDDGNDWAAKSSGAMTAGKGYIVMVKDSEMPINSTHLAEIEINTVQEVSFTGGKFNNGDISIAAVQDASSTYNTYNNNLNFVGNPYPSAISADRFIAANSTLIDGTLYFWTHQTAIAANAGPNAYDFSNADFATYNLAGGVASANGGAIPTGNIASCQGFMVPVKEGSTGYIVFNNNMRLAVNNNNFYKQSKATTSEKDRFWVNLTTADGLYRQILLAFLPEATLNADPALDAQRIPDATTEDFFTLIGEERFAIQSLPAFESNYQVAVGMQLKAENNYQISLDHTEGIFNQGQDIYLEDTYENVVHNLSDSAYSFSSAAGNDINDRFKLRFTTSALNNPETGLQAVKLYPNPVKDILNIYNPTGEAMEVKVYDATGKLIKTEFDVHTINLSNFSRGWYVVQLTGTSGTHTQKIILD